MAKYEVIVGLDYPGADGVYKRAEAGDEVDDLPASSLEWLVPQGYVKPVADAKPVEPAKPAAEESK